MKHVVSSAAEPKRGMLADAPGRDAGVGEYAEYATARVVHLQKDVL
jgi:hypothetical protein